MYVPNVSSTKYARPAAAPRLSRNRPDTNQVLISLVQPEHKADIEPLIYALGELKASLTQKLTTLKISIGMWPRLDALCISSLYGNPTTEVRVGIMSSYSNDSHVYSYPVVYIDDYEYYLIIQLRLDQIFAKKKLKTKIPYIGEFLLQ